jgi:hypothetical protein
MFGNFRNCGLVFVCKLNFNDFSRVFDGVGGAAFVSRALES